MKSNFEKVKMAMLAVQRYPWEQGVCMQAIFESGDIETAIAMAHDAVLRQQPDGRLAVINENIAVTDPAANGYVVKKAFDITGDKLWATGNGWALMGMAAVADIAKATGKIKISKNLCKMSNALLDSLLKYQLEDGRFHDLLDDENSFVDGASAMMIAAYIFRSVKNGVLPENYLVYADKIVTTMENYVDSYGLIHEVCGCPHFVSSGTSAESMAAYIMMHSWKMK